MKTPRLIWTVLVSTAALLAVQHGEHLRELGTQSRTGSPSRAMAAPLPVGKCKSRLSSAGITHLKKVLTALVNCHRDRLRGKLQPGESCSSAGQLPERILAKISRSRDRLRDQICRTCSPNDGECGIGTDDVNPAALGWPAVCPMFQDLGCTGPTTTLPELIACEQCVGETAVGQVLDLVHSQQPPDVDCVLKAGKAVARYLKRITLALRRCRSREAAGALSPGTSCVPRDPNLDPRTLDTIAAAEASKVNSICAACGGTDRQCCLTVSTGGPALVGLESGAVCPLTTAAYVEPPPFLASIAWRGEAMYVCGGGLLRISLLDGTIENPQVPSGAVTGHGDALLIQSSWLYPSADFWGALLEYPTHEAVLAGEYTAVHNAAESSSRMTVGGNILYSAWHSTDTIERFDLAQGIPLPPLTLQDYDGWILGMAVTDDGELVISGDTWGDTIRIFDAETGAELRTIPPQAPVSGLSCVTSP